MQLTCSAEQPNTSRACLRNILCNETALWGKDQEVKGFATFDDSTVDHAHLCPWEWRKFIPRSGARGNDSQGAESANNVTRTAFNTVHLLPKNLICEHGGGKLASCPWRHLTSLRPCSPVNRSSCGQDCPATRWAYKRGLPHNTDFSCCDLYEKIKSNKDFVKKVYSLQKNMIGKMCKFTNVWTLSGFLVNYIIF